MSGMVCGKSRLERCKMMKLTSISLILLVGFCASGAAGAMVQDTDFGIFSASVTATSLGPGSWLFEFDVTNTQSPQVLHGNLDGFFIQLPQSGTIANSTVPGADWTFGITAASGWPNAGIEAVSLPEYEWRVWWGQTPQSTFGAGLTAHFTLEMDNVNVGQTQVVLVNYVSGNYQYTDPLFILAPVEIPEPATLSLLAIGACLPLFRRRGNA